MLFDGVVLRKVDVLKFFVEMPGHLGPCMNFLNNQQDYNREYFHACIYIYI